MCVSSYSVGFTTLLMSHATNFTGDKQNVRGYLANIFQVKSNMN